MAGFWMAGMGGGLQSGGASNARQESAVGKHDVQLRELEHQIQRLTLLNQALWELLRERGKMTDADLDENQDYPKRK